MALPRVRAPRGPLTTARLLSLLFALGASGLALATALRTGQGVGILGAVVAAGGCAAAAAGSLVRREDAVLYGSLPALVGSGLCGAFGLATFDAAVALGMTGAVLCSLSLYELGTSAAMLGNYLLVERPRESHDIALVEEVLREHLRQVFSLLGVAFLLTMAMLAGTFLLLAPGPASPAVAGMFGALALTAAAAILVLRGGRFAPLPPASTASPAGPSASQPPRPGPGQGSGPGR